MANKLDVRTPDSKAKSDNQYAPENTASRLREQENSGSHDSIDGYDRQSDGLDSHPDFNTDSSNKTQNIDNAQRAETAGGNWDNNVTPSSNPQNKPSAASRFKLFGKKKGPLALIISLLFGGGAGMAILFSPGMALVQLKEILVGDLNDQVRAMSVLEDHLLKTKLNKLGSGACGKVTIRCKFSTMSAREVKKFKAAGFDIEPTEPSKITGRTKVTKITFPSVDGGPRVSVTDPKQLSAHMNGSIAARAALLRAFNPKFAGLSGKVAAGVYARFKTSKSQKVTATTEEEQAKQMTKAVGGESVESNQKPVKVDSEGNEYVTDDKGQPVYREVPEGGLPEGARVDAGQFDSIRAANQVKIDELDSKVKDVKAGGGGKAVGSVMKAGLKGISLLGAADTACTVWNTARAVSAAAKSERAIQLVQFAMVFFNVADRIKAGVAFPEEVEFLANKLTAVDERKEVPSTTEAGKMVPNPTYGKSGLDSAGYKTAAYNEAPFLSATDSQYMIGGALVGELSSVLDMVSDFLGGKDNIRSVCSVVQSWWARGIGLIAGLVSAAGSFGASTAISVGLSITFGFAMPFLEAALADIIAGKVVDGNTKGMDATNASFAGAAALLGGMAAGHGLKPANKKEVKEYAIATEDMNQQIIAAETYEAQKTPLDINNQYSFLGSAIRKINPTVLKSSASISAAMTNLPSFLSIAAASMLPTSKADVAFNPQRFSQCTDDGYSTLGIDADVFCNPRYATSMKTLTIQPDEAAVYMLDKGHIEEDEVGTPKSDEFKNWVKYCAEREDGLGETSNDDDNSDEAIGKICVTKDKNAQELERLDYFAAYYIYFQLQDTKENGFATEVLQTEATMKIVSPVTGTPTLSSGYGPRKAIPGAPNASRWHAGIDINSNPKDVVAIADGYVLSVGGEANTVVIQHEDGLKSQYLHMEPATVKVGDPVKAGDKIGTIGCAGEDVGICAGDHLHFNIWIDGVKDKSKYSKYKVAPAEAGGPAGKAINPANFLTNNGVKGFEELVNEN